MILFASDLDNTLIFSHKKKDDTAVCVEIKDGYKLSFMTMKAYSVLQEIVPKVFFVPVTTRSIEQYKRVQLFKAGYPQFALTSNGGILLVDNNIDKQWYRDSQEIIEDSIVEFYKGISILKNDPYQIMEAKVIDGVFVFTKTRNVAYSTAVLEEKLNLNMVSVNNHGEKLYITPIKLNKGSAVKRLQKMLNADYVICSGDSSFDIPMLQIANLAVIPKYKKDSLLIENRNLVLCDCEGIEFAEKILDCVLNQVISNEEGK